VMLSAETAAGKYPLETVEEMAKICLAAETAEEFELDGDFSGQTFSRIVIGLQGALDFERGGDLANNLNELYGYVTRRLLHVNARNDLDALEEIFGLMNEIRSAWEGVPDLIPASPRAGALLN